MTDEHIARVVACSVLGHVNKKFEANRWLYPACVRCGRIDKVIVPVESGYLSDFLYDMGGLLTCYNGQYYDLRAIMWHGDSVTGGDPSADQSARS